MSTTQTETIQVVSFDLERSADNKEHYAVPIEQVKEIRSLEDITTIPKTKSYVRGIMNLRGQVISVIDVKDKLGFDTNSEIETDKQRILVAEINNSLYGLLVDSVDQVMKFSTGDIDPAPTGTFESVKFIKGIIKTENKLIVLLDAVHLINNSEEEISNVKSHISQKPKQEGNSTNSHPSEKTESANKSSNNENLKEDIPEELKQILEEDKNNSA